MDSSVFRESIKPALINGQDYIAITLDKLRWDIYEFLIRRKFTNEFEEDEYNEEFDITKYLTIVDFEHIETVMKDLKKSGWKTFLAYGHTCMFIYLGDQPARCRQ